MNCKNLDIRSKVEDIDQAQGIVKIRVSAFDNVDSYGDIMGQKAFNKTISDFNASGKTRIKHLKNHSWNQAIGVPLSMTASDKGLDIVSKINLEKQIGADTFSDYKFYAENGQTLEHSIGYYVVDSTNNEDGTVTLNEVKLLEYSSLDFLGANSETPLLDLKNANMTSEELIKRLEEAEARIKALESQKEVKEEVVEEKEQQWTLEDQLLFLKNK